MEGGKKEIHNCDTTFAFGSHSGPENELITVAADRDFSAGQGNWTVALGGAGVSWDNTDMDFNCGESNSVRLAVSLAEGSYYIIGFDVSAYTSGNFVVYMGGDDAANYIFFSDIILPSETGSYAVFLPAGVGDWVQFFSGDLIGSIDNVSVKHASATLIDKGKHFLSCGCAVGMPIYNTTQGTDGLITAVTEDAITDDTNKWTGGDEYEIYLQTKDTFISSQIVDRSRGWRTDPENMIEGWRKEDLDIDRENPGKVFGPGQPE